MVHSTQNLFEQGAKSTVVESILFQSKLRISTTDNTYYLDIKDIIRVQSESNYSKIFFVNGKSMLVCKILAHFEELLTGYHFARIHRTHLVNLSCVKQYGHGSTATIGLTNDEILPVARRKRKEFQETMRSMSL